MPIIVQELPNLKILSLEDNKITIVPDSIGNLSSLEELNLKSNHIESLPEDIEFCFNLKILNLANNAIESLPESIHSLCELNLDQLYLSKNPLSLLGFFEISAITCRILNLDSNYACLRYQILLEGSRNNLIARSVVKTYPNISMNEFSSFLYFLLYDAPEQLRGIVEFGLPISKLCIGLDENGKLSNELDIDMPISEELFDRTAVIKKETGKTSIEAFTIARYLQGILNFYLIENLIDQIDSTEMRSFIYQVIGEKIEETNYRDDDQEMMLEELTAEDKALAGEFIDEIINGFISQQVKGENKVEEQVVKDNDPIIDMVIPINSEKKEEVQESNIAPKTEDFHQRPLIFGHKI